MRILGITQQERIFETQMVESPSGLHGENSFTGGAIKVNGKKSEETGAVVFSKNGNTCQGFGCACRPGLVISWVSRSEM